VSVYFPAYDEEANIAALLSGARRVLSKVAGEDVLDQVSLGASGAVISAEPHTKARREGFGIVEGPVSPFPRTAGRAPGADLRVSARAFRELVRLRRGFGEPVR
jgi:hypothetical protein